jgi:hypothetical protein
MSYNKIVLKEKNDFSVNSQVKLFINNIDLLKDTNVCMSLSCDTLGVYTFLVFGNQYNANLSETL